MKSESTDTPRPSGGVLTLVLAAVLALPAIATPQEARDDEAECVRVSGRHANVHMGPSSGQPVLVLVPKETVLRVVERRGEWIGVRLVPEFRETGMVMRWYRNEDRGYLHQSTVEPAASCDGAAPARP